MEKKNKLWFSGEDAQLAARFTKCLTKALYNRRVSLQFVPDYLAKLSSAAHPLSRFAPLLRQFAFGKRCPDEDDSGVAGTQRFLYHREYLFAFGLRFQGFFGRSNAERAWNGFESAK